jgi:hypothetical protein
MPEPTLDWSTAEVRDAKLTVQVEGDVPDGWEDTFKATAKLLGGGTWGEITLEEQKAEVSGVQPGSEEKLKHFLESVVLQANSTHVSDEEEEEKDEDGDEDQGEDEEESESDEDKQMSERFRSFAEDEKGEGSGEDEKSTDEDSKGEESDSEKSKAEKS